MSRFFMVQCVDTQDNHMEPDNCWALTMMQ